MMEGSDPAAILREIQSLARSGHVPVRLVTPRQIQQAQGSEAPQGVIAFAEPLAEADLSDLVGLTGDGTRSASPRAGTEEAAAATAADDDGEAAVEAAPERAGIVGGRREAEKMAFLVVVDGVTDPQNLGALLRSAECAGVTGVVLPRHRSAHVTPTVAKVAAGAVEHVEDSGGSRSPGGSAGAGASRSLDGRSRRAGTAAVVRPPARRPAGRPCHRRRGQGSGAALSTAVRRSRTHPPARFHRLVERVGGRCRRHVRGHPAKGSPAGVIAPGRNRPTEPDNIAPGHGWRSAPGQWHVVPTAVPDVELSRPRDLRVVLEHLHPVRQPARHAGDGEQHREHLEREPHGLVDEP